MSENYQQFIERIMGATPDVTGTLILDKNANVIDYSVKKNFEKKLDSIVISTGVAYLSILKLVGLLELNTIEQFYVKGSDGYLIVIQIDSNRLLLVKTTRDIKLGLILYDIRRTAEEISKIPYSMPTRKISLERKLEEIEEEFQEKY